MAKFIHSWVSRLHPYQLSWWNHRGSVVHSFRVFFYQLGLKCEVVGCWFIGIKTHQISLAEISKFLSLVQFDKVNGFLVLIPIYNKYVYNSNFFLCATRLWNRMVNGILCLLSFEGNKDPRLKSSGEMNDWKIASDLILSCF